MRKRAVTGHLSEFGECGSMSLDTTRDHGQYKVHTCRTQGAFSVCQVVFPLSPSLFSFLSPSLFLYFYLTLTLSLPLLPSPSGALVFTWFKCGTVLKFVTLESLFFSLSLSLSLSFSGILCFAWFRCVHQWNTNQICSLFLPKGVN